MYFTKDKKKSFSRVFDPFRSFVPKNVFLLMGKTSIVICARVERVEMERIIERFVLV